MADTTDLKSVEGKPRVGSTPTSPTISICNLTEVFGMNKVVEERHDKVKDWFNKQVLYTELEKKQRKTKDDMEKLLEGITRLENEIKGWKNLIPFFVQLDTSTIVLVDHKGITIVNELD